MVTTLFPNFENPDNYGIWGGTQNFDIPNKTPLPIEHGDDDIIARFTFSRGVISGKK
jgi:hypothetical protein